METVFRGTFRHQIRALVAIGGIMLLVVVGWLWWHLLRPLPSDALLRRRFHDHRRELDQLAAMAQADTQLVRAGHDWILMGFSVFVRNNSPFLRMLSEEEMRATGRLELRRLLDRVGLPSISRAADGSAVRFVVMSRGEARKGIVFSEKPLARTRSSLDGLERVPYVTPAYAPLAPRWFLFLESSF